MPNKQDCTPLTSEAGLKNCLPVEEIEDKSDEEAQDDDATAVETEEAETGFMVHNSVPSHPKN